MKEQKPSWTRSSLLMGCCVFLLSGPAWAQHHGGGGGSFVGSFLGGAAGSAVGNLLTQQPAQPAPVYVPTPVYVPQRVYVAPAYPQPPWTLAAQQRLRELGLLGGAADGVFGEGTRRAIMTWQTIHNRPSSGYLNNDELALLLGDGQPPSATVAVVPVPVAPCGAVAPAPIVNAPARVVATSATMMQPASVPSDPLNGVKDGMPYGQARQRLIASGWQTGFFGSDNISDNDRNNRAYFMDHRIMEVEDCSASGCAMQFHNNDGRLLYVFTETGSRNSDAYRGAGPAVIGVCLDVKDMACPSGGQNQAVGQKQAMGQSQ